MQDFMYLKCEFLLEKGEGREETYREREGERER